MAGTYVKDSHKIQHIRQLPHINNLIDDFNEFKNIQNQCYELLTTARLDMVEIFKNKIITMFELMQALAKASEKIEQRCTRNISEMMLSLDTDFIDFKIKNLDNTTLTVIMNNLNNIQLKIQAELLERA
jgi:hypothetical protein